METEEKKAWAASGEPLYQAIGALLEAGNALGDGCAITRYYHWLADELTAMENTIAAAQAIVQEREQETKLGGSRPFSAFIQEGDFAVQAEGPTSQETRDLLQKLHDDHEAHRRRVREELHGQGRTKEGWCDAEPCPALLNALRQRDEARAEVERLKYAGMAEAHEARAADEFKRERDESNAELKRIFEHLPERHLYAVRDCPPGQGTSHAVALCVDELCDVIDANKNLMRERDEARAEAEHWRAMADMASATLGDGPFPPLPWDTKNNAAIDRLAEHIAQHDPDRAHYIRTRALTDDDETWMSVPLNPDYQTLCAIAAGTWDAVPVARHSTDEHGDCPHWCEACRVERDQRDAEASDLRALAEREAVTEGGDDE